MLRWLHVLYGLSALILATITGWWTLQSSQAVAWHRVALHDLQVCVAEIKRQYLVPYSLPRQSQLEELEQRLKREGRISRQYDFSAHRHNGKFDRSDQPGETPSWELSFIGDREIHYYCSRGEVYSVAGAASWRYYFPWLLLGAAGAVICGITAWTLRNTRTEDALKTRRDLAVASVRATLPVWVMAGVPALLATMFLGSLGVMAATPLAILPAVLWWLVLFPAALLVRPESQFWHPLLATAVGAMGGVIPMTFFGLSSINEPEPERLAIPSAWILIAWGYLAVVSVVAFFTLSRRVRKLAVTPADYTPR